MSIEINGKIYRELRCTNCRKLICLEYVHSGRVAFHCPRCSEFNVFTFKSMEKEADSEVDWDKDLKLRYNKKMRGGEK